MKSAHARKWILQLSTFIKLPARPNMSLWPFTTIPKYLKYQSVILLILKVHNSQPKLGRHCTNLTFHLENCVNMHQETW